MQFVDLTEVDLENIEFGLRLVKSLRWEHMIAASRDRLNPHQEQCNKKYAEALGTYEKVTGLKGTA